MAGAGPQRCGRTCRVNLGAAGQFSYVENASAYKQRTVKKLVVISQARSGSVVEEDLEKMKLNEPDGQVEIGAAG